MNNMIELSSQTRIVMGIIGALAGVVAGVFGNLLSINILYFLTRKGRKPTSRPFHIWLIFYFSVAVFIFFGSIATFASSPTETPVIATPTPSLITFPPSISATIIETVPIVTTEIPTLSPTPSDENQQKKLVDDYFSCR